MAKRKRSRRRKRRKPAGAKAAGGGTPAERAEEKKTEREPGGGLAAWWPHVIAAFVIFHALANTVNVVPNVARALDRRSWADARIQREMRVWSGRFGLEPEELEERLYDLAVGYHEVRSAITRPFEPYMDLTGMRQSWLMFNAGTEESDRFGVRMRRCELADPCYWEPLYVHADPEHDWRAAQLGHPRVRSMIFRWGWPSYHERYEGGCRAIAAMAFDDFSDAEVVQCRFERTFLASPPNPDPPPPEWGRPLTFRREELR